MPGQPTPAPGTPGQPTPTPQTPSQPTPETSTTPTPSTDAFARAPEGGTQPSARFDREVIGDLIGVVGNRVIFLPPGVTAGAFQKQPGQQFRQIHGNTTIVVAPQPLRTAFKISENESPRPTDRVFFSYNYYNNVDRILSGQGPGQADFHRETIGFEKTFLDSNASFGMRLPIRQLESNGDIQDRHLDDLSLIFKYAWVNDRFNGNVLSTGMVVTLPTGDDLKIDGQSDLHSTVFQPFLGYIYHFNRDLYVQGFSSVAVPTDARDVTLLFNSMSFGYWLYRNDSAESRLTGIVPALELHLNTPLNHRGLDHVPVNFSDSLNFTGGVHFDFRRATLGIAAGVPLTGPKPYDFEALANINVRF
jgi:hypothetical protein